MRNNVRFALSAAAAAAVPVVLGLGYEPKCEMAVEMVYVHDMSQSFVEDRAILETQLLDMLNNIDNKYPGSKKSFATFVDKPLPEFGYPPYLPYYQGDWCWEVTHALDHGKTNADAVAEFVASPDGAGYDWPENQLGALHDIAKGDWAKWTTDAALPDDTPIVRVMVMATDSVYHIAGEGANSTYNLRPNDGSAMTDCEEEDYPTIAQVSSALASRGIYTVFLAGQTPGEDMNAIYNELLVELGVPGKVYDMMDDGSNLTKVMEQVFADLEREVCSAVVDVVFSQDTTWSITNDLPHFQAKMDEFMTYVTGGDYHKPRFGLTSFADKPLTPFGDGPSGDFCFRIDQTLTADTTLVSTAAGNLQLVSGLDWRESQLDALISSVLHASINWRLGDTYEGKPLFRYVVLQTDAGFHRRPHAKEKGYDLLDHNGQAITDDLCTRQEYPTWEQMAQAFVALDVHPIFVPTSDIASIYKNLLKQMEDNYGITGYVVELKDFGAWPVPTAAAIEALTSKLMKAHRV